MRVLLGTPIQMEGRRAWPSCSRPWGPPWWPCALGCAPSVLSVSRGADVLQLYHPGCFQVFTVTDKWESVSQGGATSRGTRPLLSLRHVSPARPASSPTLLRPVFPLAVLVGEDPTGGVGSDGKSRHLHEGPAFRHLRCGSSTAESVSYPPGGFLPDASLELTLSAEVFSAVLLSAAGVQTQH